MNTVDQNDIIAYTLDETHLQIVPPRENDSENVQHMKAFMLACLARRNLDGEFERDMMLWLHSITEDEFRGHSAMKPIVRN